MSAPTQIAPAYTSLGNYLLALQGASEQESVTEVIPIQVEELQVSDAFTLHPNPAQNLYYI